MAAISRAQMMKELIPGLNALFGMEYERYEDEHTAIYEGDTSERSFEEDQKLSGFGTAPVKAEGAGVSYDQSQEAYSSRYTHETIALAFALTEESVEDNLYAEVAGRNSKALGRAMANTKQVKAAFIPNSAYSSTLFAAPTLSGGSAASLCDEHDLVSGGTNNNLLSTAADLNESSLEAALIAISKFTDERGLKISCRGRRLIVPTDLQFTATRLLQTQLRTETADNDISAIYSNSSVPDGYSVNHYFTSTRNWFLMTDIPNGMKHYTRVALQTDMDGDFDTGNTRYKARERYSFGVSDVLHIFGSGSL